MRKRLAVFVEQQRRAVDRIETQRIPHDHRGKPIQLYGHQPTNPDVHINQRLAAQVFDDIDDSVAPLLKRFTEDVPRIAGYREKLTVALANLDDGEDTWLASPLIDSYHTVWMHLHQELILTLGMSRKEDEELEERLVAESGA